ncbi:proteasomal ubiquitin receptor ADRM1 isoform 1 [Danaus plexippus plexippus]|uniref:Proteasomal ubiquitin receptor ADRM1 homolog n=1 Tax=Danaus plexippus plexippus TaxID=278856 RepID=A0A212F1Y6_DANPL|nr:proteasomal ubiquitin receptor ADRM1-A isoform X1 [Danaus plexippus plexippus]XP_032528943.1 proteasomal ubiquitin receptor ADRM1-A isoform X1 [Danaus plexippus plexippus]OWR47739.1 proteasomal ubiquitin receptor ADRM1 isoform 1 [Danaus plexippus plexippus]
MSATALFGNTSGLGGSSGGNKHLVEFRAGRMTLKGRMVHPDKRKGLLYVYQGEDSLMHFCWKDRTTGEVEDDLLIFPDDCEFVRVNECTTGRVYVLKFKSFSKKYFFWMQEPKTDKDDEYCRRLNEALNNPPTSGGRGGSGGGAQDGDLHNLLNNMSQQQLMQLFGGVGQIGGLSSLLGTMGNNSSSGNATRPSGNSSNSRGGSAPRSEPTTRTSARARDERTPVPIVAPTPATVPAPTATPPNTATGTQPRSGQIFLSDLQRYFSGLGNAPPEGEGAVGGTGASRVELGAALATPEVVSTASEPANSQRLAPHLPPAPPAAPQDDVRTTLLSPQFAQAANQFSSALTSGQMGPVMTQFGLPADVTTAANTGDMQAFFKALESASSSESGKSEGDRKKDKPQDDKNDKKDGDAGMSLD